MKWEGMRVREFAKEARLSLRETARRVGVSRQTVNEWIGGQVPKGNHLLSLCKLFKKSANAFFSDSSAYDISVPIHRQKMNSKITESTQKAAVELAKEYASIFMNSKGAGLVPVVRTRNGRDMEDAKQISEQLRSWSRIPDNDPADYEHTFELAKTLGIYTIFRNFPKEIKSYAFYVKIHGHRVVLVNNATNVIDLIFPMLHESVHAVRDEIDREEGYDEEEEAFCDTVASFVQFPLPYIERVYQTIKRLSPAHQVNTLKGLASMHGHSLYGIVKAIKIIRPAFELHVGGADSNLRKQFPTIGAQISAENDVRKYLRTMRSLSGNFLDVIAMQIDSISGRKLAEILGVDSELDAGEIRTELLREMLSSSRN